MVTQEYRIGQFEAERVRFISERENDMYLISIYFDENADNKIRRLIHKVAEKSENRYMIEAGVPPHITISAFETDQVNKVIDLFDCKVHDIKAGKLQWVSIGVFNPHVIFLSPVLNEYLHKLSVFVNETVSCVDNVSISRFYLPLQWMPHTTIGKKLSVEEMLMAFKTLQNNFRMFEGTVTKIGLAKTNPYQEIRNWDLK